MRTGLIQLRDEKIRHGHYHLTVDAWVLRPDGRFLITQRAPEKIAAGQWECTGGSVLYGEDSLEGALRELREETGLVLKPENGHCVISQRRDECRDFKDVWLFRQDFSLADVVLQPGETCDARAVTPEEIRAMLADGTFVNIEYFEELMALM
ncbi:MAG: NUDIX domain-containing protein [Oscillospiraceae bacterium]|nr:NUDIX domain-containing protein [Oscillospiraceae bacterium]